jgi:hypothetical protein
MPTTPSKEIVRFVHGDRKGWDRLSGTAMPPFPHEVEPRFPTESGKSSWIVQTWIYLKRQGMPVELAARPRSDRINVIHYDDLSLKKVFPPFYFLIVVQADRPRPEMCSLRVVQNELCIRNNSEDFWLPHWPQPGLRPRAAERAFQFERMAYFGLEPFLGEQFRTREFRRRLEQIGVQFSLRLTPEEWSNYEDVDGVLAVRQVSSLHLSVKPPSKLINAWKAGAVPLMGREPAYQQVRKSDLDYVEVESADDVIEAVVRLKSHPLYMQGLLSSGARRSSEFSEEMIAKAWVQLLEGPAREAFLRWRRAPGLVSRLLRFPRLRRAHVNELRFFASNL